jgi:hypothetical protein
LTRAILSSGFQFERQGRAGTKSEMSLNTITMPLVLAIRSANARGGTISPGRTRSGFTTRNSHYWPKMITPKVPLP